MQGWQRSNPSSFLGAHLGKTLLKMRFMVCGRLRLFLLADGIQTCEQGNFANSLLLGKLQSDNNTPLRSQALDQKLESENVACTSLRFTVALPLLLS